MANININDYVNPDNIYIETGTTADGKKKAISLPKYLKKISKDVYSSEEIKTNKVWVDENGNKKPVYKKILYKTFELPTKDIVTSYVIAHGILNIETPISCEAYNDAGTRLPFLSYGQGFTTLTAFNSTNIEIRYFKDSWSLRMWTFICEYTKTTD